MLDFKELSEDGNDLELLIREILLVKGYRVQWSGKGPDGGKDLICREDRDSVFLKDTKKWLIQCKHNAHSGSSVGLSNLDNIVDSCSQHDSTGYLLVCSTYPSSAVISRLEGITANHNNSLQATYWDSVKIEQILSTPKLWTIAQRFFPVSSKNSTWEIYATESPNQWIANYRGYHFHLSNRIGSKADHHFSSIDQRIDDLKNIKLPENHFIRIRAVYFDDKNGAYSWFLDYMYPHTEEPATISATIEGRMGDGWSLSDGQFYNFDVITRPYYQFSDHYDIDHYDYYQPYLINYQTGINREQDFTSRQKSCSAKLYMEDNYEKFLTESFNLLTECFKVIKCAKLMSSVNAQLEKLDKFNNLKDWSDLIEKINLEQDCFFSSIFKFKVIDKSEFLKMISYLPQEIETYCHLRSVIICKPDRESGGSIIDFEDDNIFELTISLSPFIVHNSYIGRKYLNDYMIQINDALVKYIKTTSE